MGGPPFLRNKRGEQSFALSVSDAYEWHRRCPCQPPRCSPWTLIGGKGDSGAWAAEWMAWLWRTHLEGRGFILLGTPSRRVLDLRDEHDDEAAMFARVAEAVRTGALADEPAPEPPPHLR